MTVGEAGEGRRGDERVRRALVGHRHDGAKQLRIDRALGGWPAGTLRSDFYARVCQDAHQVGEKGLGILAREEAHVQRRARQRRDDVRLVAPLQARDRDGVAQQRVVGEIAGEEAHGGRVAQRRTHVRQRGAARWVGLDRGQIVKVALDRGRHDQRRLIGSDAGQGSHQPVHGVVGRGARSVARCAVRNQVEPEG